MEDLEHLMNDEVTDINEAIKVINNLQVRTSDSGLILIVFVFRAVNVLWIWVITTIKRGLCRYQAENIVSIIIVLKLLTRCVQILCQNKHQFL